MVHEIGKKKDRLLLTANEIVDVLKKHGLTIGETDEIFKVIMNYQFMIVNDYMIHPLKPLEKEARKDKDKKSK